MNDRRLPRLLDVLIPATAALPAASKTAALSRVTSAVETETLAIVLEALEPLSSTTPAELENPIRAVEEAHPTEFDAVVRATYEGYYGDPKVVSALGLQATPQPDGYSLTAFDSSSVAAVKSRGPIYRRTDQ